jgi:hypothetical protein
MKNTWTKTFRRLAAGCALFGASAFSSAMNYAYGAFDSASDPVYAASWDGITNSDSSPFGQLTAGDNGGTGFNPWNFNSSYYWDFAHGGTGNWYNYNFNIHVVDPPSNPNNNIGKAWDLGILQYGTAPDKFSLPRAARGFKALQPGDKFSTTIDNPNTGNFDYKGYSWSLNSAPSADGNGMGVNGSICYHNSNCNPGVLPLPKSKISLYSVNAGAGNQWHLSDGSSGNILTGVLTSTTAATGVVIDVAIGAGDTYTLTMTPASGGAPLYSHSGPLGNAGLPTNWVQYQNYNGIATGGNTLPTDFYVSQVSIVPEPGTFGLFVLGTSTLLGFGTARRGRAD